MKARETNLACGVQESRFRLGCRLAEDAEARVNRPVAHCPHPRAFATVRCANRHRLEQRKRQAVVLPAGLGRQYNCFGRQ